MKTLRLTCKLTFGANAAHKVSMRDRQKQAVQKTAGAIGSFARPLGAVLSVGLLAGCISLEAPDQPIVIELNINITQEVIYRLAEDAGNAIEENADIF